MRISKLPNGDFYLKGIIDNLYLEEDKKEKIWAARNKKIDADEELGYKETLKNQEDNRRREAYMNSTQILDKLKQKLDLEALE